MGTGRLAQLRHDLAAVALIAGTCIGAGLLALPVAVSEVGFVPGLVVLLVAWVLMTLSGYFFVDILAVLRRPSHLVSMAQQTLAPGWQRLGWGVYLFIGIASLAAYFSEAGHLLTVSTPALLAQALRAGLVSDPHSFTHLAGGFYGLFFLLVLVASVRLLSRINNLIFAWMILLLAALLGLTLLLAPELEPSRLLRSSWDLGKMGRLLPLMLTSFSYPGIVPSLGERFGFDATRLRRNVRHGTSLVFTINALWLALVIAVIPASGTWGLEHARREDVSAAVCLLHHVSHPLLRFLCHSFSFSAITTSFIGMAWGMLYFVADGFGRELSTFRTRLSLGILVFWLPYLCFVGWEKIFFAALSLSGGMGDTVVSLWLPALMVLQLAGQQAPRPRIRRSTVLTVMAAALVIFLNDLVNLVILR